MDSYWKEFLLAFVPLFVAMDPMGSLPIVLGIIGGSPRPERIRIINLALTTALALGFSFLFVGRVTLHFLDIKVDHFAIAGGLILLILAIKDLVGQSPAAQEVPDKAEMLAVVPIGTPLTAGPGTLATLLVLADRYPVSIIAAAYVANVAIAWVVFVFGDGIAAVLGRGGMQALSKIAALVLGAIAVRLIVEGVIHIFGITAPA